MWFRSPSADAAPTALLVEDEQALRDELRDMLAALWPELHIVGEAQDGLEALRLVAQHQPRIVFLDVQIPDPNGLEVARHLGGRCHVVFVTAYDAHAIDAFEKGAVDYLLKPLGASRLSLTIVQAGGRLADLPDADMRELPDLGGSFNHDTAWRHELARLSSRARADAHGSPV